MRAIGGRRRAHPIFKQCRPPISAEAACIGGVLDRASYSIDDDDGPLCAEGLRGPYCSLCAEQALL